jgi:hypothetical protein
VNNIFSKNKFLAIFGLFIISIFFVFQEAYSQTAQTTPSNIFPYEINFTESEIKLLKTLDPETLQKLVQVAKLIKEKNLEKASSTTAIAGSTVQMFSDTYSPQTPFYNSDTGKYQSLQPTSSGSSNPFLGNSPTSNNNNNSNPYLSLQNNPYAGSPQSQYFNGGVQSNPNGGYDSSLQTLNPADMKDLPKLGSGGENCQSNFGVNGNMNGTTNRLRFDTNRLCVAFGKRLKVVDAKRGCGGPSRHCLGEAIDFDEKVFGDRKQQAIAIVAFISLGYNIGSYEKNFPLHADHEEASKWKTWSRWAHTNGQAALPYADAVRDALSLIGMPANSAAEFRSKYGNPPKSTMSAKAKAFLQSVYGGDAGQFTPAQ